MVESRPIKLRLELAGGKPRSCLDLSTSARDNPGKVLLNQNLILKNAQALGIDRRGPSREGPALLQGLVICGKCGRRMTLRYHVRHNKRVPDYMCQSHGIEYGESTC